VLFTDIVGSTALAAQIGDERWRRLVADHHSAIRRLLKRHAGREMDTAGDGFFASFEQPTDAVRCARDAVVAVHGLGLEIRAGIHTGEVDLSASKPAGLGVHIGARLLGLAGAGDVLVSGTVHDLVAGAGMTFQDRGTHALKGIPGEWRVYALDMPTLGPAVAPGEMATAQPRSRARAAVVGISLIAAALVLGIAAATVVVAPSRPLVRGPNTIAVYAAEATEPGLGISVRTPSALVAAAGSLWVTSLESGTVSRIDPASGALEVVGPAGARPSELLFVDGRIWVSDPWNSEVTVLDAATGAVVDRVSAHASALAAASGSIWATDDIGELLLGFDPRTRQADSQIKLEVPAGPSDITFAAGALWVAAPAADRVLRFHPDAEAPAAPIDVPGASVLSGSGPHVWAASTGNDRISRIDTSAGRVGVTVEVCDAPVALAAEGDAVWVACATDRSLWKVEASGEIAKRLTLDAVPTAVAVEGGSVWVALRFD